MSSIEIEIEDAPLKFEERDLEDPRDVILGEGTAPLESHDQPTRGRELMPIDWKIALSDEQLGEEAALMVLGAQRLLAEREADKARQLPKAERAHLRAIPFRPAPALLAALRRLAGGEMLLGTEAEGDEVAPTQWTWVRPGFPDDSAKPQLLPSGGTEPVEVVKELMQPFDWVIHTYIDNQGVFSVGPGGESYLKTGEAPALWCAKCAIHHLGGREAHP